MKLDTAAAAAYIKRQLQTGALSHFDLARIVERAQLAMGLEADGMPGPQTLARLDSFFNPEDLTPAPVDVAEVLPAIAVPTSASVVDGAQRRLERARRVVGQGRYHLGSGGKNPAAATPFDSDGSCDCSGLVCWVLELPRKDPATGVWRNTDQLEADARGQVRADIGEAIEWKYAIPGDVVVYGAGPKIGHTGIVSAIGPDGPTAVIHCRSGAAPAVVETGPSLFKVKGAVILRPR